MNDPNDAKEKERLDQIAALLLAKRAGGTDWGESAEGGPWSKKKADKFLLGSLLDYQMRSEVAWRNADRLSEEILDDAYDIWRAITSVSEGEWKSKRDEYNLHRFPAGHDRLWRIAKRICDEYGGDSRLIWEGKQAPVVLETLWQLGAGDQISRMVVGAPGDCGQIEAVASDVKADTHVCRVLGRALIGAPINPEAAIQLARRLNPSDPWQLDAQLWHLGNSYCHKKDPACSQCYLAPHCAYALGRS